MSNETRGDRAFKIVSWITALVMVVGILFMILFSANQCGNQKPPIGTARVDTAMRIEKDGRGITHATVDINPIARDHFDRATDSLLVRVRRRIEVAETYAKGKAMSHVESNYRYIKPFVHEYFVYDTVRITDSTFDITKRSVIVHDTIRVEDTLFVTVTRKDSWFGEDEYNAHVSTGSEFSTITGMNAVVLNPPRKKRFGLGMFVGVGVNHKMQVGPVFGLGLQYNIINF